MPEKIVSQKAELLAQVTVKRSIRAIINPNGRMYSEDNVTKYLNDEVTQFTVKAATPQELRIKVDVMLSTIDNEE
jgi:uncharacterized protein YaiI (UPF0178 family)